MNTICGKREDISEQVQYLSRLAKESLAKGDIAMAAARLERCIRMIHKVKNRSARSRLVRKSGVYDHWRVGCCRFALGVEHWTRAAGHLNVVRRYYALLRMRRGEAEMDPVATVVLCRALAALARIYNLQGRHDCALLRAEEGLDALYRNAELAETGAADLIQMLCFSARGDALRGLGHCGEGVVRNYEQVLRHYQRHVSAEPDRLDRIRLVRRSKGLWPWTWDRVYPETALKRTRQSLTEMMPNLSDPMKSLSECILQEIKIWLDDNNIS